MGTNYEAGHAKNVANSENMNTVIATYGSNYNPSNASIQLPSLNAKAQEAKASIDDLKILTAQTAHAIAAREVAFEPLQKLGTRLVNALKATSVSQPTIDTAMSNNRKLQGSRAKAKLTEAEKLVAKESGKPVKNISVAQLSYDNRLNSFDMQIKFLETIPEYAPNEPELQITTLQNLYNDLLQKNRAVVNHTVALSNGRLKRNEVLYHPETGMVALALDAKNYIKSVFGVSSPQYKQISGITFKQIKT